MGSILRLAVSISSMALVLVVIGSTFGSAAPAGASTSGLVQGATPNKSDNSPTYLQRLFGTPTDTTPTLGTDFLPAGKGWNGLDGAKGSLAYLEDWANSGDQLVLAVPIIPRSGGAPVGSLEEGASGGYDQYFTQLAQTLVSEGLGNAWLRLGWEFDNNGYPWKAANPTDEGYFAAYFRNIVTTIRAVSGGNFKFIWNPDGYAFDGAEDPVHPGYDVSYAWPGAAYVDYIGLDLFDLAPGPNYTPTTTWEWIDPQLTAAQRFASQFGEPIAFPVWGVVAPAFKVYGMRDDPLYVNNMYDWMSNPANDVAWESYFNVSEFGWNSKITGGSFPKSLAAFRADFGNR